MRSLRQAQAAARPFLASSGSLGPIGPVGPATGSLGGNGDAGGETATDASERVQPRLERAHLGRACEVCGNVYDKPIELTQNGKSHVFDSFECAIHALAPQCAHCGCRIVGHGMESDGRMFCCAHCAHARGVAGLRDRS